LILIDTAPALLTSDCQLLAKHVDAIAIVVRADADQRGMLSRMLNRLDGQRADILGIVLNGVRSAAGGYFRKSYEEFYRYNQNGANGKSGKSGKSKRGKSRRGAEPVVAAAPSREDSADFDDLELLADNAGRADQAFANLEESAEIAEQDKNGHA
jgi:Mrp family chromosome partitioning ATPase